MSFLILAVLAAFMAGGQISAMRGEESKGRLDRVLAASVSRSSWLGGAPWWDRSCSSSVPSSRASRRGWAHCRKEPR